MLRNQRYRDRLRRVPEGGSTTPPPTSGEAFVADTNAQVRTAPFPEEQWVGFPRVSVTEEFTWSDADNEQAAPTELP